MSAPATMNRELAFYLWRAGHLSELLGLELALCRNEAKVPPGDADAFAQIERMQLAELAFANYVHSRLDRGRP